jgi:hypothetical protein
MRQEENASALEQLTGYMTSVVELRSGMKRRELRFIGMEDLLLQKGRVFSPVKDKIVGTGWPKACFQNCYRRAIRSRKWVYCEGLAVPDISIHLPVHHAWLSTVDQPDHAFEPTWVSPGLVYWGIAFRREYIRRCRHETNHYSVLDVWERSNPLLTGKERIEDYVYAKT